MRLTRSYHFLTLVLVPMSVTLLIHSKAQSAPSTEIKPDPVPVFDNRESARLIPSQQNPQGSTNIGIAMINGVVNKDKDTENVTLVQLQRTQYNFEDTAQEFGISFLSNGIFGANWGFKWLPNLDIYGDPWYKVGVWGLFDPRAQLGNFIDYERYYAFGSVGFENILKMRRQFRVEVGAGAGAPGVFVFGQLIYAYPD